MIRQRLTIIILVLASLALSLFQPQTLQADEAAYLYNRGNDYYRQGDYNAAVEAYSHALLKARHPYIYYNLANSYFRLGDLGLARLNYERALRLAPRDDDIRQNMSYLEAQRKDKALKAEKSSLEKFLESIGGRMGLNEWVHLGLFGYLLILFSLFMIVVFPGSKRRYILVWTMILSLLFLALISPFTLWRYYQDEVKVFGVAVADEIIARGEPEEKAAQVFSFHEGMKVRIRQTRDNWHQIVLPNGLSGWVKAETIAII